MLCSLALACESSTEPVILDLPSEAEPLIQTDALSYQLHFDGIGFGAEIPYTFENRTGVPIYLVNCGGGFSLHLERWDGDKWAGAWVPVIPACLSPPIVIGADAVFVQTLRVWGAAPDQNHYPRFDVADPSGTYRIVWGEGRTSYKDHLPWGELLPLAYRISNGFELVIE